jgi:hypothetical protein
MTCGTTITTYRLARGRGGLVAIARRALGRALSPEPLGLSLGRREAEEEGDDKDKELSDQLNHVGGSCVAKMRVCAQEADWRRRFAVLIDGRRRRISAACVSELR